jgi:hypothetical protein
MIRPGPGSRPFDPLTSILSGFVPSGRHYRQAVERDDKAKSSGDAVRGLMCAPVAVEYAVCAMGVASLVAARLGVHGAERAFDLSRLARPGEYSRKDVML